MSSKSIENIYNSKNTGYDDIVNFNNSVNTVFNNEENIDYYDASNTGYNNMHNINYANSLNYNNEINANILPSYINSNNSILQGNSTMNNNKLRLINNDKTTLYIFTGLNIFCVIYFFISLIWLYHYRKWYIVKQRNFILTFIGGIATFLYTFFNLITQVITIPCAYTYYSPTVFSFIMQLCFISRAIRLILLYKLNVFKVTELSKEKFIKKSKSGAITEPNIYYKSIYKMVDKRIVRNLFIILVTLDVSICVYFHYKSHSCSFSQFVNINDKIASNSKLNAYVNANHLDKSTVNTGFSLEFIQTMFLIPKITSIGFGIINFIIAGIFTFSKIRDDHKFGIKFDCFSNAVVLFTLQIIKQVITNEHIIKDKELLEKINYSTKNGTLIFVFTGFYIQTTSVVIPLIKCIRTERMNKLHEHEPTNSLQYFYKVLRSPNLIEELKTIAIQEFSVENVLFWENYCILRKYANKVIKRQNSNININNSNESNSNHYLLQDINSQSSSSQDDEYYNPNFPLNPELLPYYNSFYHTFIDINGAASVNLTSNTVKKIHHAFYTFPTIGIFDEAKDEIVETMFFSIFPTLLQQNRKQLGEIRI
ncbi:hypothetical protein BCR32DRAFT_271858 [Anaeromyces robustus]|uniref:RGS domain-containing protein n=1 Tax=Anaeromyces robustus TaxID=1754192 RepID=A0A1Y1WQ89_9FUNG|nr:hypothetical protein BCR32DRAFT_271858 [Anaeromyces robustus]|eukprot:ORX75545.1 hypothetical protein BCR32DRAFT_271858 [Anaeromyces robustus]